jgi:hypothetical protein
MTAASSSGVAATRLQIVTDKLGSDFKVKQACEVLLCSGNTMIYQKDIRP